MQTMTARDAKTNFGVLLDTMQREPVLVTKNKRPVGIMISIEDAADSLIPELFMQKQADYDEWLAIKINKVRASLEAGTMPTHSHEAAMDSAWNRLQAKAQTQVQTTSAE
jgi:prevent-host-death family protein